MPPTGGPTRHGSDFSPEKIEMLEEFFAGSGDGDFELEQSYAGGDLAVLVGVERQYGTVAGIEQDWSLRVTLVFRRAGSGWRLVHRHADALVHPIDVEHVSRLARGAVTSG
jgi:ketosteroid isomerase-like protein